MAKKIDDLRKELMEMELNTHDELFLYHMKQCDIIYEYENLLETIELDEPNIDIITVIANDVNDDLDFAGDIWAGVEYNGKYDMTDKVRYIIEKYIGLLQQQKVSKEAKNEY